MLTSPLLFAAGTFWAVLGSLKTRDNTSRRKLPGEARVEGGSCLYHVTSLHFAEMWLACDAAIYYLWWWIAQASAAALTCEESLEMAERSLALSPEGGMPGTGLWVAKAGDGWMRGGLWPKAEPTRPGWRPISCWCTCKATGVGG